LAAARLAQPSSTAMAYGIKAITGTYVGDSRSDWMIFGDFEYRNGRKTPNLDAPGLRPEPPPSRPRKSAEVVAGNLKRLGAKTSQVERWAKRHAERGEGHGGQDAPEREDYARRKADVYEKAMASSQSAPVLRETTQGELGAKTTGSMGFAARRAVDAAHDRQQARNQKAKQEAKKVKGYFDTTYLNHGQIPGWQQARYELPVAVENAAVGLPRGECEYDATAKSGDYTRGMKGRRHFFADSHNLGQVEVPGQERAFELEKARQGRAGGVYEIPKEVIDKALRDQVGELTCGIHGRMPHRKSLQSDLGYDQNFVQPEKGVPEKYWSMRKFKDQPDLNAKKAQEGDECLGIKTGQPHFKTDAHNLGNIPNWPKSRYSMEALAMQNYRLTLWHD